MLTKVTYKLKGAQERQVDENVTVAPLYPTGIQAGSYPLVNSHLLRPHVFCHKHLTATTSKYSSMTACNIIISAHFSMQRYLLTGQVQKECSGLKSQILYGNTEKV